MTPRSTSLLTKGDVKNVSRRNGDEVCAVIARKRSFSYAEDCNLIAEDFASGFRDLGRWRVGIFRDGGQASLGSELTLEASDNVSFMLTCNAFFTVGTMARSCRKAERRIPANDNRLPASFLGNESPLRKTSR